MKKALIKAAVLFGGTILTLVATATAASACWIGFYQPEEPKALRQE